MSETYTSHPKQKYRMHFKCIDCGEIFQKITTNINLKNPACPACKEEKGASRLDKIGDGPIDDSDLEKRSQRILLSLYNCKDCHANFGIPQEGNFGESFIEHPHCPKCSKNNTHYYGTNAPRRVVPASKIAIKAIDKTAEMVMSDYKMTDLKDDVREGEAMAPSLPPAMQKQADNLFVPTKTGKKTTSREYRQVMAQINSGALASQNDDVVARTQHLMQKNPTMRPKINIVAGDGVR